MPSPTFGALLIATFACAGLVKHKVFKACLLAAGIALLLAGLSGLLG